tara:strand:- start:34200 stop:34937 length:738 start_codon:yes stop_codon:yes gene_type:complete
MIIFHQYGARRTGTNYLQALLEENYSNIMVLDNVVWKHEPSPSSAKFIERFIEDSNRHLSYSCAGRQELYEILYDKIITNQVISILNIKNPYAWIESMQRYTQNLYLQKSQELQTKYIFLDPKKPLDLQKENIIELIESYNKRYKRWGETTQYVIRYEDVLRDHKSILQFFEKQYNLQRIHPELLNIKTGCDPVPVNLKYIDPDWDYKDYYLEKKYLKNLSPNVIEWITNTIDWTIFERYQYSAI